MSNPIQGIFPNGPEIPGNLGGLDRFDLAGGVPYRGKPFSGIEDRLGNDGSSSSSHPFKVVNASANNVAKIKVTFGTVNNSIPTIGGVALDAATAPTLNVASGYVYLRATVDSSGALTGVTVATAAAVPADSSTLAHLVIASITVASGNVTNIQQSLTHSLGYARCGISTHLFWGI